MIRGIYIYMSKSHILKLANNTRGSQDTNSKQVDGLHFINTNTICVKMRYQIRHNIQRTISHLIWDELHVKKICQKHVSK